MKECLIILSVIVVFIVFEYFIERVRDRVLDVAIPVALMGVFVTALRFLFLTTFPRCIWLRWVIVVVLCAAFYLSFDNRALIHPRYVKINKIFVVYSLHYPCDCFSIPFCFAFIYLLITDVIGALLILSCFFLF